MPSATATRAPTLLGGSCSGDCNGDGDVTIDELLTAVLVGLGTTPIEGCAPADQSGDGEVTIDELLVAVNRALSGCDASLLQQGRTAMSRGRLGAASRDFCEAAAATPEDHAALLNCALTRAVANIVDNAAFLDLLRRAGVTLSGSGDDICGLGARIARDVPIDSPRTGEIFAALRADVLPQIEMALAAIREIPATIQIPFDLRQLPSCMRPSLTVAIEIDQGDVLALSAWLQFMHAVLDTLSSYDLDIDLQSLAHTTPRGALERAPALLTLTSPANLTQARGYLDQALSSAGTAIGAILAETDNQSNDVVVISAVNRAGAQRTLHVLDLIRQSVQGVVAISTDIGVQRPERLNLSLLLGGQFQSLRPFLPSFTADGSFAQTFPDPSFGGTAPDLTQDEIQYAVKQVRDFLPGLRQATRHDCFVSVQTRSAAECEALRPEYDCRQSTFYPLAFCDLSACRCTL